MFHYLTGPSILSWWNTLSLSTPFPLSLFSRRSGTGWQINSLSLHNSEGKHNVQHLIPQSNSHAEQQGASCLSIIKTQHLLLIRRLGDVIARFTSHLLTTDKPCSSVWTCFYPGLDEPNLLKHPLAPGAEAVTTDLRSDAAAKKNSFVTQLQSTVNINHDGCHM